MEFALFLQWCAVSDRGVSGYVPEKVFGILAPRQYQRAHDRGLTTSDVHGRIGGMIAFAKPPTCDFSSAKCTIDPVPPVCLVCDSEPVPDFTVEITGLPEGLACDVCEQERISRKLLELMGHRGPWWTIHSRTSSMASKTYLLAKRRPLSRLTHSNSSRRPAAY